MTLIRYKIKSANQWQVLECRSASVPLRFSDIIQYIRVLELFAFSLLDIEELENLYKRVEMESAGLIEVAEELWVTTYLISLDCSGLLKS